MPFANLKNKFNYKTITFIIFLAVVAFTGGSFLSTGSATEDPIKLLTQNIVKQIMSSEINQLKETIKDQGERLHVVENYMYADMIKLILKNAKKIGSYPDDVKRTDIDACLSYLDNIPADLKTEDVTAAIAIIVQWDIANP